MLSFFHPLTKIQIQTWSDIESRMGGTNGAYLGVFTDFLISPVGVQISNARSGGVLHLETLPFACFCLLHHLDVLDLLTIYKAFLTIHNN